MNEHRISVVIPCFNHAHFLREAIESAIGQDYPSLEVIVVDDGSSDNTAAVAAAYAGIRYVYQQNTGLASARNTGIRNSCGDYLVFLDADDRLLSGALRAGVECITAHPECGFVYGRFEYVDKSGSILRNVDQPPSNPDTYIGLFGGNHIAMCATVIYRRDVLDRVGGFREQLAASEDYDLYFRIARLYPFIRHDALVAHCRRHELNMSLDMSLMLRCTIAVVSAQQGYAKTEELKGACRRSLRIWREYYGRATARQMLAQVRNGHGRRAAASAVTLLRFAPGVYAKAAVTAGQRMINNSFTNRLPDHVRYWLRRFGVRIRRIGMSASHRRLSPLSRDFGFDRGVPIDRFYIDRFLQHNCADIQGHVLEVKDNAYTLHFGGSRVTKSDVLDVDATNQNATIIADLAEGHNLPSNAFDCIILTQTLQLIHEIRAAVCTLHRSLRPGGVLLATVPCISQIARDQLMRWADQWRMTEHCARRVFGDVFGDRNVTAEAVGNLRAAIAFLEGRCVAEIRKADLEFKDSDYELLITIRAVKPGSAHSSGR